MNFSSEYIEITDGTIRTDTMFPDPTPGARRDSSAFGKFRYFTSEE